jgi:hypothetical protein
MSLLSMFPKVTFAAISRATLGRPSLSLSRLCRVDEQEGLISTGQSEKLAPSLEQELSHCRVLGQANGTVESVEGLTRSPQAL